MDRQTKLPQPHRRVKEPVDEPTVDRRKFIKGAAAVAAAYMAGEVGLIENSIDGFGDNDDSTERPDDAHDVLVDPDRFEAYVQEHVELAESLAADEERPIPYEVYLAVSMHESDSGASELAQNANNYFGVIAKDGWTGSVYDKPTEEEVASGDLATLRAAYPDLTVLSDYGDGNLRVRYTRPFRQYANVEESFRDFTNKLYFTNTPDGSDFRYADVIALLQSGSRDPYRVVELMADNDEEGEAQWASGREWLQGVQRYISLIQEVTGRRSADVDSPEDPSLPDDSEMINIEEIDFSGLDQPRDQVVIENMKSAFGQATQEKYAEFKRSGVRNVAAQAREMIQDDAYYESHYRPDIDMQFIVLHAWANGLPNGVDYTDPNYTPAGNSHEATLSDQIMSWYNNRAHNDESTCGYLLSDNDDGELWQVTEQQFGGSNHAGRGIQGEGNETHPDVDNSNAVGIEVQADTIFDVSATQYEKLLYWATHMMFSAGILVQGMERDQVDRIIDTTVIGHGKTEELEFGYKYTRPFIQALQQFAYIAVSAESD